MTDILADHVLIDLIRQIDRVRDDLERAGDHELAGLRILIDNALRTVADHLVQLREEHLVGRR